MGRAKEEMMEQEEAHYQKGLAEYLGISHDELGQTEWEEIDTNESEDGMIYSYYIQFDPDGPKEILDKIDGLEDDNYAVHIPSWVFENDQDSYRYEELYETITSNKDYYSNLVNEIENIRKLNKLEIPDGNLLKVLKRQLYVSGIGILEIFLSDIFINLIDDNDEYFKIFLEINPDLSKQKVLLKDIFEEHEKIKKTVRKKMLDIIYHNLNQVKKMYKDTFEIELPNIGELSKSVSIRHDLVHRNGKTKDGNVVNIDADKVDKLLVSIEDFAKEIQNEISLIQLANKRSS